LEQAREDVRAIHQPALPVGAGASLLSSRSRTYSGTRPDTSPPKRTTSLISDEERYDHCGSVATKNVSTPAIRLFIWAIWTSNSKSVTARNPLTTIWMSRDRA